MLLKKVNVAFMVSQAWVHSLFSKVYTVNAVDEFPDKNILICKHNVRENVVSVCTVDV